MAKTFRLVQGDTRPAVVVQLTDENTGAPIDVSLGGASVRMFFRARGGTTLKDTLIGVKLTGFQDPNTGVINTSAPYNVAGAGGRVQFNWGANTLDTVGTFEGEIEVTFADSTKQTVPDRLKFKVQPQIA